MGAFVVSFSLVSTMAAWHALTCLDGEKTVCRDHPVPIQTKDGAHLSKLQSHHDCASTAGTAQVARRRSGEMPLIIKDNRGGNEVKST